MIDLPQEFTARMQILLGDEYPSFLKSYEEPRRYGLRVNTLKISTEEFQHLAPFHLKPIPWIENGFFYEKEDAVSRHPFYYAGLYYLQEPSAMTPAQVLPVTPGERVLDLCAAPGGKATALAAKLQGEGLLVANDISASRAKALLKNLEVFGAVNTFVTNTTPAVLARQYPEAFDKILVDAPCSGEGMFRKDIANAKAWSLTKVKDCAKVQKEIILQAASMLRPGGKMLYSTCTFSPEENEQVIAYLLENCPEMEVLPIPMAEGFESGCPELAMGDWQERLQNALEQQFEPGAERADRETGNEPRMSASSAYMGKHIEKYTEKLALTASLTKCVRIFPHKMPGEGHFMALLGKRDTGWTSSEDILSGRNRESSGNWPECKNRGEAETEPGARSRKVSGKNGKSAARTRIKPESKTAAKAEEKLVVDFLHAVLTEKMEEDLSLRQMESVNSHAVGEYGAVSEHGFEDGSGWQDIRNKIEIHGSQAYYVPVDPDVSGGIPFLRSGLYLGEIKKDRFEPSQALAMAICPESCPIVLNFDYTDERVTRYLRGETIEMDDLPEAPTGWRLVCVNSYPLGWGKFSGGLLKNKYHPGWRIRE